MNKTQRLELITTAGLLQILIVRILLMQPSILKEIYTTQLVLILWVKQVGPTPLRMVFLNSRTLKFQFIYHEIILACRPIIGWIFLGKSPIEKTLINDSKGIGSSQYTMFMENGILSTSTTLNEMVKLIVMSF